MNDNNKRVRVLEAARAHNAGEVMEMLDVAGVPVIFADDIGSIEVIGSNARFVLVQLHRVGGELVREPVAVIIRPIETLKTVDEMIRGAMEAAALAPKRLVIGAH